MINAKELSRAELENKINFFIKKGFIFSLSEGGEFKKGQIENVKFGDAFLCGRKFEKVSPRARQIVQAYYTKKQTSIMDTMGNDWHNPDYVIIRFESCLNEKIKKLMKL